MLTKLAKKPYVAPELRQLAPFRCAKCGEKPDAKELARIAGDDWRRAVAWRCPACAPDLQLTKSGLCFDVVEVGGSSPEHEYDG